MSVFFVAITTLASAAIAMAHSTPTVAPEGPITPPPLPATEPLKYNFINEELGWGNSDWADPNAERIEALEEKVRQLEWQKMVKVEEMEELEFKLQGAEYWEKANARDILDLENRMLMMEREMSRVDEGRNQERRERGGRNRNRNRRGRGNRRATV
jgi:hypothetical protein